jgi:L-arabinokinase
VPSVFFYISGHGFGHASRQIEIINQLGSLHAHRGPGKGAAPKMTIVVRTSAPRWLFERTCRVPVAFCAGECDTGVVQVDSLRLDERATIARAAAYHEALGQRADDEAARLRGSEARLVVADAPPLACVAADRAGTPSVVVSNFTWDWIYEEYRECLPAAPGLIPAIRSAYALAREGWRLPMHGGFNGFSALRDMPFVARHSHRDPGEVRRALGLPPLAPLLLPSFGGYGVQGLDLSTLDCLGDCAVVVLHRDDDWVPTGHGVYQVSESSMYGQGLRYEDIVRAVDVVVTKPGYGIIADCIANGTALLYTSRGRFAEYPVLVSEMPRFLQCGFIDQEALLAGRWREALDKLSSAARPPERANTDGAIEIAELILERM